jgi:hypothetical protein
VLAGLRCALQHCLHCLQCLTTTLIRSLVWPFCLNRSLIDLFEEFPEDNTFDLEYEASLCSPCLDDDKLSSQSFAPQDRSSLHQTISHGLDSSDGYHTPISNRVRPSVRYRPGEEPRHAFRRNSRNSVQRRLISLHNNSPAPSASPSLQRYTAIDGCEEISYEYVEELEARCRELTRVNEELK